MFLCPFITDWAVLYCNSLMCWPMTNVRSIILYLSKLVALIYKDSDP